MVLASFCLSSSTSRTYYLSIHVFSWAQGTNLLSLDAMVLIAVGALDHFSDKVTLNSPKLLLTLCLFSVGHYLSDEHCHT